MSAAENLTHIGGIMRGQWFAKCADVRRDNKTFGLTPITTPICDGGLCKRHNMQRNVTTRTADGLDLCRDCAVVWAVRRFFHLPHGKADL